MDVVTSIVTDPAEFLEAWSRLRERADAPRTMRGALLVGPDGFALAAESTADNAYMNTGAAIDRERARVQHEALARKLRSLGVPTLIFQGREDQPDGVFPNNAFATAPGRLIVGRMRHAVRQRETQREDIRSTFASFGYEIIDLSTQSSPAELTGTLILDHPRGVGFCGLSDRVDCEGCRLMHDAFGARLTLRFDLVASEYHTNIVLSILAGRACVIYPPSFADRAIADAIVRAYAGRALVLSDEEKAKFAGNCLAITAQDVLFSSTSAAVLRPESKRFLESMGFIIHSVDVDEFEKAGGSLRCLIAEVF